MMQGRCGTCGGVFDVVALPLELGKAANVMKARCRYCPWCGGHKVFCHPARLITPEELPPGLAPLPGFEADVMRMELAQKP